MASDEVIEGGMEIPGKLKTGSSAVASATTLQLGDTNQHIVSGTTTINAITAGSANVLLSGSGDLTTAA